MLLILKIIKIFKKYYHPSWLYEKVHELVWMKLNESKCTVKQWNLPGLLVYRPIFLLKYQAIYMNDPSPYLLLKLKSSFHCYRSYKESDIIFFMSL